MSAECSSGNIPSGYKQTEVGVIPENWGPVTIGDIAIKVGSGITPRGGNSNYKEYGRPFVRSQNIGWGILLLADLVYIDDDTHKSFSSTELRQGDVLLNITGASIGRSAIADARLAGGNVNQHVCIIRTDATEIDPCFLNFILLSAQGQRQIDSFQAGGNREGLNFGQIRSIRLSLPPTKAEQESIAEALSDTDALIESLEQLIAKKSQIKQGAMQELLTGKRRLQGFEIKAGYKSTEAGVIPEDWSSVCYADYLNTVSGLGFKKAEYCDIGIRLLRIDNVSYGQISWDSVVHLPLHYAEKFPNLVLSEGDILLALNRPITNNQLKLARLNAEDSPAILYQRVGKIEVINNKLDKTFAYFILRKFIRKFVEESSVGSDQPFVSTTALKKIHIPLPPTKAEQEAIATILFDMDSEITVLEEKLAKTRQIKQGMMQELLTGRIRLI